MCSAPIAPRLTPLPRQRCGSSRRVEADRTWELLQPFQCCGDRRVCAGYWDTGAQYHDSLYCAGQGGVHYQKVYMGLHTSLADTRPYLRAPAFGNRASSVPTNCFSEIPNTPQNTRNSIASMRLSPRSHLLTKLCVSPMCFARLSWVRPARWRASRSTFRKTLYWADGAASEAAAVAAVSCGAARVCVVWPATLIVWPIEICATSSARWKRIAN